MDRSCLEKMAGYGTFVVLVAVAFVLGPVALTRAVGVVLALGGIYSFRTGRISYGIEGREPAGYISGAAAKFLSLVVIALGMLAAIKAPEAACFLGWAQSGGCA